MSGQGLLEITDEGKKNLKLMVEALKAKKGSPDWFLFTGYVTQQSGIKVSKDVLYRTSVGIYVKEPSMSALAALGRLKELTYLDSSIHPNVDDLMDILFGLVNAYGKHI